MYQVVIHNGGWSSEQECKNKEDVTHFINYLLEGREEEGNDDQPLKLSIIKKRA